MRKLTDKILYVPQKKLDAISELSCSMELSEGDKLKNNQVFPFCRRSHLYVCTGGVHYVKTLELDLYRIIHVSEYKGALKPLSYGEHLQEVDLKRRPRCYTGRMVIWKKKRFVICEKITLFPLAESENIDTEQLTLF